MIWASGFAQYFGATSPHPVAPHPFLLGFFHVCGPTFEDTFAPGTTPVEHSDSEGGKYRDFRNIGWEASSMVKAGQQQVLGREYIR